MADETPPFDGQNALPPLSGSPDPIRGLLRMRIIGPPSHPGAVGSVGHYEILSLIGAGGMGIVLRGRDWRTGSKAAIKVLRPELARPSPTRCESVHAGDLRHPTS
jgi:serine/threonine protein kinase